MNEIEILHEVREELTPIFNAAIEARDSAQVAITAIQEFRARLQDIELKIREAELAKQL